MRESARTDLREPQGSNPLGPPGPELVTGRMETNGNPNVSSPQSKGLASIIVLSGPWVLHSQGKCDSS